MPKALLIRMSSMGDIIHTFPAVTELKQRRQDVELHWVVEEAFVDMTRLHPGVDQVIPFALRRWRKNLLATDHRREMSAFKQRLRTAQYDLAIDSQGLLKSVLVGKLSGAPLFGYSRATVRDPAASFFYDHRCDIPPVHVIDRNRMIVGQALGYVPEGSLDYGVRAQDLKLAWQPQAPYVVCLTATARAAKLWNEERWLELGQWLRAQGLCVVFPWGNDEEKQRAERLADALPGSVVPPRFSLIEAARLLADAQAAIGVDTGLMHMAAAVDTPTVGIFCDSDPHHAAPRSRGFAQSLGGVQQQPAVADVRAVVTSALASHAGRSL